jgi:asparagine synthase (glutamine-hydrolysing)
VSLTAFVCIAGNPPKNYGVDDAAAVSYMLANLSGNEVAIRTIGASKLWHSSVYADEAKHAVAEEENGAETRTVVFDGWLENRDELIAELGEKGISENSSDCEIVSVAFGQWGEKVANRLYGEYSFFILKNKVEAQEVELLAVRDKVGIRPLFYSRWNGGIAFSNFPGALSAIPWVGDEINEGYAAEFLCVDVNSVDQTLYKNVQRVRGGHSARWNAQNGLEITRYWFPPSKAVKLGEEEAAAMLRERLNRVVFAASRSDGIVGVQMSGGVDSSSVACVVAGLVSTGKLDSERVMGMSQLYPGLPCDETLYIEALEKVLPFQVEKLTPKYASVALIDDWTKRLRYPVFSFAGTASIMHDERHRKRGGRVVLTGEGGDELFQSTSDLFGRLSSFNNLSITLKYTRSTYRTMTNIVNARGAFLMTIESLAPLRVRNALKRFQRRRKGWHAPIDNAWANRVNLADRLDRLELSAVARTLAVELALTGGSNYVFEHSYESNFVRGVEKRCPLLSASVLELINCFPLDLMDFPGERNRRPLRDSVRDRLPQIIRERVYKSEFTSSVLPVLIDAATQRFGKNFDSPRLGKAGHSTLEEKSVKYVWQLDAAQAYRSWITSIEDEAT